MDLSYTFLFLVSFHLISISIVLKLKRKFLSSLLLVVSGARFQAKEMEVYNEFKNQLRDIVVKHESCFNQHDLIQKIEENMFPLFLSFDTKLNAVYKNLLEKDDKLHEKDDKLHEKMINYMRKMMNY